MARKRKTKEKQIVLLIIIFIVIILSVLGIQYGDIEEFLNPTKSVINKVTAEESENILLEGDNILQIHFFDVGQADSILLISNNQTMLIDAGNNDDGNLVVNNIKKLGISKLDYVIGTHPHEDHIGGLDDVILNFEIGTIYMPKVQTNTKTFEDVLDAISSKNLSITAPNVGDKFMVGSVEYEVMLAETKEEQENLNLSSIVIRATYGEQSYLFMGDSEEENESSRSWEQTNVLKVGHHGSSTSSSKEFLNQVLPQIAIISVGKDNSYGHPHNEVIDRLEKIGTLIYRTDKNKNILIESDGRKNKVSFY